MTENEYKIASATRTVNLLDAQADRLRQELDKVRRDLTAAQRELFNTRSELERIQLEQIASKRILTCTQQDLTKAQRALAATEEAIKQGQTGQLQEANQQLLMAALKAEAEVEVAVTHLDELSRVSQRDPLTDTPNRTLMLDRVETALVVAKRRGTRIALLFLDVDNFKKINDTFGHVVGDGVVQLFARRLEAAVRDSDTVSRHGGDEFLVLITDVADSSDVALIAVKILTSLKAPSFIDDHELNLSASLGIAIYPDDAQDAMALIACADKAMYTSKRAGAGSFEFYRQN